MYYKYLKFILFSVLKLTAKAFYFLNNIKAIFKSKNNSFTKKQVANDEGIAVIETIPLLSIFIFLFTYTLGYWGSVHSGVLSAIGARTYAFETFRNRGHLSQFRENMGAQGSGLEITDNFIEKNWSVRIHRVVELDGVTRTGTVATKLPISFASYNLDPNTTTGSDYHSQLRAERYPASILGYGQGNANQKDNDVWLQIGYGYCLTLQCGD